MTGRERLQIRRSIDEELRRRLKLTAKSRPRRGQCLAGTYVGGRCANAATDPSGYCYAHREAEIESAK